jgi:hypothetical protein
MWCGVDYHPVSEVAEERLTFGVRCVTWQFIPGDPRCCRFFSENCEFAHRSGALLLTSAAMTPGMAS